MVFLALTRAGYDELTAKLDEVPSPIWVNAGVLSASEVSQLRADGVDLSCFTNPIDHSQPSALVNAVATISEHHPGQAIWVEQLREL